MKNQTLLSAIVSALVARANCEKSGNVEWLSRHSARLENLQELLPSGSGFDSGTKIDVEKSLAKGGDGARGRIFLQTSFHHMNEGGLYDGWTEHQITVCADLLFGFSLKIGGRDRNDIKNLIAEVFSHTLSRDVQEDSTGEFRFAD